MKYAEETHEEIQEDGSIVLRRVIVPIYVPADQKINQEPNRGVIEIQIWGNPLEE